MRHLILAAAAVFCAAPAMASSILVVKEPIGQADSIETLTCDDCPAPKAEVKKAAYQAPSLPPGTQKTEIVDRDGTQLIIRNSAWMGGSPVTYVNNAKGWAVGPTGFAVATAMDDDVDTSAKTAAVQADPGLKMEPVSASMAPPPSGPAPHPGHELGFGPEGGQGHGQVPGPQFAANPETGPALRPDSGDQPAMDDFNLRLN